MVMLRSLTRATAALMMMGGVLAFAPATVLAEERTCRGTIGARTLDNVRVPPGATCQLNRTMVKGTIKVERNAVLIARGIRVVGNVQAENARRVVVAAGARVGGSVQAVQGGRVRVVDSRVNADILVDENDRLNTINRNRVGGNIQAFQNTGGVRIYDNRVDGNLQCKENRPRPVGERNVVQGNKEDQCRRF
jgi:hypothetical protein